MKRTFLLTSPILLLVLLLGSASPALAGDLKFQALLIWGTDQDKPDDPKLKAVEAKLMDKFRKVFKWKNYFEVSRQDFAVPISPAKKVKISDKCEIEVQNFEKAGIEVKLFGEGKHRRTVRQVIPPGEYLILAGDDKDNSAWFVVLTPAP